MKGRALLTGLFGFLYLGPEQEIPDPWMPPEPVLAGILKAAREKVRDECGSSHETQSNR